LAYFGDSLPNTYYLKMTGLSPLLRIASGLRAAAQSFVLSEWLLVSLVVVFALHRGRRLLRDKAALLLLVFAAQWAYSIFVGGDLGEQMPVANRYIAAGASAALIFVCASLPDANSLSWRRFAAVALIGVVALLAVKPFLNTEAGWQFDWRYGVRFLRVSRALVIAGLIALTWSLRSASPRALRLRAAFAPGLALCLFASLNATLASWVNVNATYVADDNAMMKLGLDIKKGTRSDFTQAVVWAGAPPYWSERFSVDLLGKCDRIVAREPSHTDVPFKPGHSKWDYQHSIDTYRPDVLLQTWRLAAADRALLESRGYRRIANQLYVNSNSERIDVRLLESLRPPIVHVMER
jgi:hypothetical protein